MSEISHQLQIRVHGAGRRLCGSVLPEGLVNTFDNTEPGNKEMYCRKLLPDSEKLTTTSSLYMYVLRRFFPVVCLLL